MTTLTASAGSATALFNSHRMWRELYFLSADPLGAASRPSDAAIKRMILSTVVCGRDKYPGLIIDAETLGFVQHRCDGDATRLQRFALSELRPLLDEPTSANLSPDQWYYQRGVPLFDLWPLLTAQEWTRARQFATDPGSSGSAPADHDAAATTGIPFASEDHAVNGVNGVNIFGFANAVMSLSEDLRQTAATLHALDVPFCICNIELSENSATREVSEWSRHLSPRPIFPINMICLPWFESIRLHAERGHDLKGRYNIGLWPWELANIPPQHRELCDWIDEIWAPTDFVRDAYTVLACRNLFVCPPVVLVVSKRCCSTRTGASYHNLLQSVRFEQFFVVTRSEVTQTRPQGFGRRRRFRNGARQRPPYPRTAASSGCMPTIFSTRVRL